MLTLTILGNNSAIPAFGRNPTAQHLQFNDDGYLIDCGEGIQLQMAKYKIRRNKVNHIFISHLHGDHYFGLPGLISTMNLLGRTHDLHVYGPPLLEQLINFTIEAAKSALNYKLYFHPITEEKEIMNDGKLSVQSFKVEHRIECWGFLFKEIKKPRKIDGERIHLFEIPSSFYERLQKGEDYITKKGTIIPNSEVTLPAPAARTYAYCADTIYNEGIADKVKNVDLLYHETTYLKADEYKAAERYHSTTLQAANIAKLANAKKLIIGHFSAKYEMLDEYLKETSSVFENTELALEGVCFKI